MIHYQDNAVTLHAGDCLDILREMPDNSVDAVVTDPPYGLEFMGKEWDAPWKQPATAWTNREAAEHGDSSNRGQTASPFIAAQVNKFAAGLPFQQWCELWTAECLRVLRPGGHLLAFGGTRTWHRLAVAVEDAGFEMRDSIAWLYASGFPKSLDVSKAIDRAAGATRVAAGGRGAAQCPYLDRGEVCPGHNDAGQSMSGATVHRLPTAPATDAARRWQGWGTALKPGQETVVCAQKPLTATEPATSPTPALSQGEAGPKFHRETIVVARKPLAGTVAANVLAHGTGALNIDACRINTDGEQDHRGGRWPANVVLDEDAAAELDRQSGNRPGFSGGGTKGAGFRSKYVGGHDKGWEKTEPTYFADSGGASRFFKVAPADQLDNLDARFRYQAKAPTKERPTGPDGTRHPTTKPLELMRWLVRLVTPPAVIVCDNGCYGTTTSSNATALPDVQGRLSPAGQCEAPEVLLEGMCERVDEKAPRTADVPSLFNDIHPESVRREDVNPLLSVVLEQGERTGEEEGAEDLAARIRDRVHAGTPDGDADRLHPAAPQGHGRAPRPDATTDGSGASPERGEDGQPAGKSRGAGQAGTRPDPEAAAEADRLPSLRGNDRGLGTCPECDGALVERGGLVLEPFAGSGTTVEACLLEGFRCIAIEREASYLPLIEQRIRRVTVAPPAPPVEATLFDFGFDDGDAA